MVLPVTSMTFAPSGIDDYCVLNRNLVHEDDGFLNDFDEAPEESSN